jgi:uncharacterized protein YacL (UPF0231 family)
MGENKYKLTAEEALKNIRRLMDIKDYEENVYPIIKRYTLWVMGEDIYEGETNPDMKRYDDEYLAEAFAYLDQSSGE